MTDQTSSRTLKMLYEISEATAYLTDYNAILRLIVEKLAQVLSFDMAGVLLVSDLDQGRLSLYSLKPAPAAVCDELKANILEAYRAVTDKSLPKEGFLVSHDLLGSAVSSPLSELQTLFNVPLTINDKMVGVFNLSSNRERAFSVEDTMLLSTVANQLCGSLERFKKLEKEHQSRMKQMVHAMSEGVIMLDKFREVFLINPAARAMLAPYLPAGRVQGTVLDGVFKGFGFDCAKEDSVKEVQVSESPLVIWQIHQQPVQGEQAEKGWVIILRDITEPKRVEKLKDAFLGTMSHEFRTPLAIIKGCVDELGQPGLLNPDNPKAATFLGMVRQSVERLSHMISNILDFSRLESGRTTVRRTHIFTRALVREVVVNFQKEASMKGVSLTGSVGEDVPPLFADQGQIEQVLYNLLGNALRFAKSEISVAAVLNEEGEVQITVSDDGPGIPSDKVDSIFDRFVQVNRPSGAGYQGTGLGLSICKEIIRLNQGRIWAESVPGGGARFHFTLPTLNDEEAFRATLKEDLQRAEKENLAYTFFGLFLKSGRKPNPEKLAGFFQPLDRKIRLEVIRISDKTLFSASRGIFLIMAQASGEAAERVRRRLDKVIGIFSRPGGEMELSVGSIPYPGPASNPEELLELLHQDSLKR